jgi:hypothetical protein
MGSLLEIDLAKQTAVERELSGEFLERWIMARGWDEAENPPVGKLSQLCI